MQSSVGREKQERKLLDLPHPIGKLCQGRSLRGIEPGHAPKYTGEGRLVWRIRDEV